LTPIFIIWGAGAKVTAGSPEGSALWWEFEGETLKNKIRRKVYG